MPRSSTPSAPPQRELVLGDEIVLLPPAADRADALAGVAAAELLARYARIAPGERVLACPCGSGALGAWAARQTAPSAVLQRDTNWAATRRAGETWRANGLPLPAQIDTRLPEDLHEAVDVALLPLPKGRDLARLLLLAALRALRPGGRLYLAGANDEGIKSVIGDAEALFGPLVVLGYKGGQRVALAERPAEMPDPLPEIYRAPGIAACTWHEFSVTVGDDTLHLRSRPGIFSWQHLDPGTALLLDHLPVRVTDRVLDVGCGYGVLGLAAARIARRGYVTLVDVDGLACECARVNLALNGIANAEVTLGSGVAAGGAGPYSLIISNPPFHTGHEVSLSMAQALVREALAALEPGGRLLLVANRFLAYDHAMAEAFGEVQVLAQNAGYRLLLAEKSRERQPRGRDARRRPRTGDYEETIYQIPD